jgi:hypothetical protein
MDFPPYAEVFYFSGQALQEYRWLVSHRKGIPQRRQAGCDIIVWEILMSFKFWSTVSRRSVPERVNTMLVLCG